MSISRLDSVSSIISVSPVKNISTGIMNGSKSFVVFNMYESTKDELVNMINNLSTDDFEYTLKVIDNITLFNQIFKNYYLIEPYELNDITRLQTLFKYDRFLRNFKNTLYNNFNCM